MSVEHEDKACGGGGGNYPARGLLLCTASHRAQYFVSCYQLFEEVGDESGGGCDIDCDSRIDCC